VTLTESGLRTSLSVSNDGKESFQFQTLFHTYLRVKDITVTKVTGLAAVTYVDKVLVTGGKPTITQQSTPEIAITGEVDRVYENVPQSTTSVVSGGQPLFDVVRDNLTDVVVWNPWIEKAKGMGDFEPKDGYKNMLCIEAGSVSSWQTLDAGESWEGGQYIKTYQ
jgi:glucose-6-phosphate 1-epimerase